MYYDLSNQPKTSENLLLQLGPLKITPQQIGIGIMVELLTFIPSILIVQVFRRIRPRQQISPIENLFMKMKSSFEKANFNSIKKKSSEFLFPWWCIFIAYTLSIMIIILSIFFIIDKTQKWLTSVLTGFLSSICLIQPIKIICLAIFFALFIRRSTNDKEEKQFVVDDQIDFHDYVNSTEICLFSSQSSKRIYRLSQNQIEFAREQRLQQLEMFKILKEFFVYFLFALLVFLITYSNQEPNSFLQVQHLQRYFLNRRQTQLDYTKISTIDQYWNWLRMNFIENLRAQQWYNGDIPQYLNGFLNDKYY
ncbi:hypothetical protein I4U23_017052 [Adineta vaga]|nr:hypothetical protein I4U23_017052 [Adineta vaga]